MEGMEGRIQVHTSHIIMSMTHVKTKTICVANVLHLFRAYIGLVGYVLCWYRRQALYIKTTLM